MTKKQNFEKPFYMFTSKCDEYNNILYTPQSIMFADIDIFAFLEKDKTWVRKINTSENVDDMTYFTKNGNKYYKTNYMNTHKAQKLDLRVVKQLIKHANANIYAGNHNLMCWAITNNKISIVQFLFSIYDSKMFEYNISRFTRIAVKYNQDKIIDLMSNYLIMLEKHIFICEYCKHSIEKDYIYISIQHENNKDEFVGYYHKKCILPAVESYVRD
jgi:hypothetical protein